MKKKRGNPNWGKAATHSTADAQPSSFEQVVWKAAIVPGSLFRFCPVEGVGSNSPLHLECRRVRIRIAACLRNRCSEFEPLP